MSITATALSQDDLLQSLLYQLKMSEEDYIAEYDNNISGAVAGICMEPDCLAISGGIEPDCRDGNCVHCGATGTVRSGFILMGVV